MLWKCATRKVVLCIRKSTGGTASSTPVMPPITKVAMKPTVHSIDGWKVMRPRYIVSSQLNTFTPVGTAITMVVTPKKALTLALEPMVKKWCSQTVKERIAIAAVA